MSDHIEHPIDHPDAEAWARRAAGLPKFEKTYCSQCGAEFGPGDYGYSHCEDHKDADLHRLRTALRNLSNEVLGSLPLMEQLARREFGNTNYALLIQRAEEARAILNESR